MTLKRIVKRILISGALVIFVPIITAIIVLPFYKGEVKATVIQYIKSEYGFDVLVSNVGISVIDDWPNATIVFENVKVQSSTSKTKLPLLEAGSIRFSVGLLKLFEKQVRLTRVSISDAKINIIIDQNGDSNSEIAPQTESKSNSKLVFDLKRVRIKNVVFNLENRQLHKHIGIRFMDNTIILKKNFINYSANISGGAFIEEFLFNAKKGPFLKNARTSLDLNVVYYPDLKTLMVGKNSTIEIENQIYILTACLDAKKEKLALRIMANGFNYEKTLKLLNTRIRTKLREVAVTKSLDANALIVTALNAKQDPELFIKIRGRDNFVFIGDSKVPFSNVNFDLRIECIAQKNKEPEISNAKICIDGLSGNIYSVPFTAKALIENLRDPRLLVQCKLKGDGQQINNSLPIDLHLIGKLEADVVYAAALKFVNRKEFLGDSAQLNASLLFRNITYMQDGTFPLTLNGNATINEDTLKFKNLKIKTNGGLFHASGIALGFSDYACGLTNGFKADVKAISEAFDLSPFLLAKKSEVKKRQETDMREKIKNIKQTDFEFVIAMNVKNVTVRNVNGTNMHANLHYHFHNLDINDLSFNLGKGSFKLKGQLEKYAKIQSDVELVDVDVNLLFQQFENFNQKAITAENLQGTVNLKGKLQVNLNEQFEFEKNSLFGNVDLKISEGHLIDYEPLQKVSNFIFRKRNFQDITFTQMEQKLVFQGDKLFIEETEIASNVLNFYVEGIYSFKGISNINIRVPWNNLKSRNKDFVPVNFGKDGGTTRALKLNINGYPNKMKISLGNKN